MKYLLALAILISSPCLANENVRPEDFAYSISIETDGAHPLYEIEIPLAVYRSAIRNDLGDMRIFDDRGSAVPFTIKPGGQTEEDLTEKQDLKPVILRENIIPTADELSVMIQSGNGNHTQVHLSDQPENQERIAAYLFALPETLREKNLKALTLQWQTAKDTFIMPVTVEASTDLKNWNLLSDAAVVSQLAMEGMQPILGNRIELAQKQATYLRLKIDDTKKMAPDFRVIAATAEFSNGTKPAERLWLEVQGSPAQEEKGKSGNLKPGTLVFAVPANPPADRLEVVLPHGNQALEGTLSVADNTSGKGRHTVASGLFYRLKQDGHELASSPVVLENPHPISGKPFYFFEPSSIQEKKLSIRLGWVPEKAVFVAQGEAPYFLAYGSSTIAGNRTDLKTLTALKEAAQGQGIPGEEKILGGPQKLLPPPPTVGSVWGRWISLAGLCLATLLLGFMAYRLLRPAA